jgi:hypothetical protein
VRPSPRSVLGAAVVRAVPLHLAPREHRRRSVTRRVTAPAARRNCPIRRHDAPHASAHRIACPVRPRRLTVAVATRIRPDPISSRSEVRGYEATSPPP